jgi:hypothetical protein
MKLSQSPEAMELKRRLWEGYGLPLPRHLRRPTIDAAEHNRRARALIAQERWQQRMEQMPAERLQRAIDSVWEQTVEARRELEAEAARSCHRGLGDPDWPGAA